MAHGDLAQTAAVLGAAGSVLVLVPRSRLLLAAGFGLLTAAEACFGVALVPRSDFARLDSPVRLSALVIGVLALAAVGLALARMPSFVPILVLVAAPFRLPVDLGHSHAFLLLPLYAVLVGAGLALLVRTARGPVPTIPPILAIPAAAFIVFDSLSLLWAQDLHEGSIELAFFIFPFAALVAVVARSPFERWLPAALAATVVGLAAVFSVIGLWQEWTRTVFFAQDLRVANTYTTFFRVTSVFKDPSIYGRHLVLGATVLIVLLWLGKVRFALAASLIAVLFAGLYFSYSQSSMLVLFVSAVAVTLVLGDPRSQRIVLLVALASALSGAAAAATSAHGHSLRKATSGRSRLITITTTVIERHPAFGVGVGSQPLASRTDAKTKAGARRDASHTTPLTVLAELGAFGFLVYVGFLAASVRLLHLTARRHRAAGIGFASAFLVLFLHSLFYSGFFEDPLMWGTLAVAAASLAVLPAPVTKTAEAGRPQARAAPRLGREPAAGDVGTPGS